ncbi:unnamed protein product [Nippostrongylus brasiliensis]|uniref:Aspartate kinase n=1 Tax=Nippostrongylus brasiliensis TaxID=27835 RepID=A0A0N4YVS0_NIPBR|nr:hypothetical protein Q1695_013630 [Nippostrongylus brasiliensis]VDL85089.1 unnamed protein product [Nippostrongylus brasiliensis]
MLKLNIADKFDMDIERDVLVDGMEKLEEVSLSLMSLSSDVSTEAGDVVVVNCTTGDSAAEHRLIDLVSSAFIRRKYASPQCFS